jgi:hypothetical protein
MNILRWIAATACVIALPALAAAQTTDTAAVAVNSAPAVPAYPDEPYPIASHWLISGSIGSDFQGAAENPGVNFAATAGWLYHGVVGGEVQTNFSPNFNLGGTLLPPFMAGEPSVNSYMLNLIAAAPLMAGGQFQPYVSGGPGWFTMNGTPTTGDQDIDLSKTDNGWNVGAGVMGFLGQLGVRADLRYFKVSGDEFQGVDNAVLRSGWGNVVDDQEQTIDANLISGMSFWRGNVGVALRW